MLNLLVPVCRRSQSRTPLPGRLRFRDHRGWVRIPLGGVVKKWSLNLAWEVE